MEKIKKSFNDFEKLILKVAISTLIYSLVIFGVLIILVRINEDYLQYLQYFIGLGLVTSLIAFITAGVRILRYLVTVKPNDKSAKISKSIISLFISLLSLAVSYLSLLLVALATIW